MQESTAAREQSARSDWDERIGRTSGQAVAEVPVLPAPQGLRASAGAGQVSLDWQPVDGAIGYIIHIAGSEDGPFDYLDHQGRDVLSVPHPPYADTTCEPGRRVWYAVAAVSDVDVVGELSEAVPATPQPSGAGAVRIEVAADTITGNLNRPWRPMIGSEHLSHMLSTDTTGGQPVGAQLCAALEAAHTELGVEAVRAHAILGDDLGVYREVDGIPVYDFTGVDRVYDALLDIGLRPIVEISFMPGDLAADPEATVFEYGAIISPPKDWGRWYDLVRALTAHLVKRYGLEEVRDNWAFEVWNEANLEVFWSGSPEEFFQLHDLAVRAVKDVDPQLRVGGPSSAAAGWVEALLDHVDRSGTPLDFISTHTYGNAPLDFRPVLERHGRAGTPIWWTEWGVTPTHFYEVSDSVFSAAFLLRGMRSAMGRIEALSYWVVSDHFEELGRPPALFHGGFGLRTVGELRKPRWWALAMIEALGPRQLEVSAAGDGADSLVESLATTDPETGMVSVLVWNGTLDQSKAAGSAVLERAVTVVLNGMSEGKWTLRHRRVDENHSCLPVLWKEMNNSVPPEELPAWPDESQWEVLREADRLEDLHAPSTLSTENGALDIPFTLPMPGISLLELTPQ